MLDIFRIICLDKIFTILGLFMSRDTDGSAGFEALEAAIEGGSEESLKVMLQNNRELVDSTNENGRTPLMLAASLGNNPLVQLLLARGAKVDAVDNDGKTALDLVYDALDDETQAHRLREAKRESIRFLGSTHRNYMKRTQEESEEKEEAFADKRVEILNHLADLLGFKVLEGAIRHGLEEVVKEVLRNNPKLVNHTGENGRTPLMLAASLGKNPLVQLLLARGAKVDAVDNDGKTALDLVYDALDGESLAYRSRKAKRESIRFLGSTHGNYMKSTQEEALADERVKTLNHLVFLLSNKKRSEGVSPPAP